MEVFEEARDFERVVFASDPAAGMRAIVALHSTALGPALGGCRIQPYPDEHSALEDVKRLAEAMTWKAAVAGLDLGGGKAVIIADPRRDKDEFLLRAFGRVISSLDGRYITSVDVGTTTADLEEMRRETRWVVGLPSYLGGGGDPSPVTAHGVAQGMRSCAYQVWREASLRGRRVAIQGVGKVGYHLARICVAEGAEVIVADPDTDQLAHAVSDLGVRTVPPDDVLSLECDILAPCALGAVLNEKTIPELRCRVVCGAANNQLASADDGDSLSEAGILYAPDFVVNAGGLISVADELAGWDRERVMARVDRIGRTLLDVFHLASERSLNPARAAVAYAQERIDRIVSLRG